MEYHCQRRRGAGGNLVCLLRAFDIDDRGPEIRTRIGAVACKLRDERHADQAFSAAQAADPDYGPLWYELALCHKSRGKLAEAAA